MTKKDYIAIADVINTNATTIEKRNGAIMHVLPLADTVRELANVFKIENPNFDIARFTEACGIIE